MHPSQHGSGHPDGSDPAEGAPSGSGADTIRGTVRRVTFRNPENGYSVLQVELDDKKEQLTVVGTSSDAGVGSPIEARGRFQTHPKFGRQLVATRIETITPSSVDGIARYLAGGRVKGVGVKTVERLVERYGRETIQKINEDPDTVAAESGVPRQKVQLIRDFLASADEKQSTIRFLIERGISDKLAERIYRQYQDKTLDTLRRDPYLLAREMQGVGFLTADSIALSLGFEPTSSQRLKAGVFYALEKATDDGNTYLSAPLLAERSRTLLGIGSEIDLDPAVASLIEDDYVIKVGDAYYVRTLFRAEEFIAGFIAERCNKPRRDEITPGVVDDCLERAERDLGVIFSAEQRNAVHLATHNRLLVITGGPGCGKTTIIRGLVTVFKTLEKRLVLAAPTGRASQRMAQVCGTSASTIHRLLKYDPMRRTFLYGPNQPLSADAVIIDEASMIDVLLARDLFSAIPYDATIILVGDKDQLPSVGPGRVFADLIATKEVTTVALSRLFRRGEHSTINEIAHTINAGVAPEIPEPSGAPRVDAYFIQKRDPEEALQTVERLVSDQIPKKFDIPFSDICVLTPSNRGPLGTQALNQRLQQCLNPAGSVDSEQELTVHETVLRVGDRVCQRVNNYNIDDSGVFNGDVGDIYQVNRKDRSLTVEMWDGRLIRYQESDLGQLALAYAITVHRSQGSEIPCVVLVLHDSHYTLLERQLIYTAVTRAKKLLIVVGSKRALSIAVGKTSSKRRLTKLREFIQDKLHGPQQRLFEE